MVLGASLINTQHYKVRIKGKVDKSREGVAPSPTQGVGEGAFGSFSTMVANFTLLYTPISRSYLEDWSDSLALEKSNQSRKIKNTKQVLN